MLHSIDVPVADLFGGGGGFWSNVKSRDIVVNDCNKDMIDLQSFIYSTDDDTFEYFIRSVKIITDGIIDRMSYEGLRTHFNDVLRHPLIFYSLLSTCTNNMIRYNSKGMFNQTYGKRKFNPNMEAKLREFRHRIRDGRKIEFYNVQYYGLPAESYIDRLLFIDPPYLITGSGYNLQWKELDEHKLYAFLKGRKFIMTNFLSNGTLVNKILEKNIADNNWTCFQIDSCATRSQRIKKDVVECIICSDAETERLIK